MKAEIDEVKKIDLSEMEAEVEKAKEEMKNIGPKIEKEMQKAKVEIEKAKVEMKEYKSFVDGLEKDGLINKKENYSIKHKDGTLTINDKEASAETYNKYRSFLDKHKKFHIEKDEDDFDMDMD
jgi:soluble cytochrome b562